MKAIEDELGVPLFVGPGMGVMLTSAGKDSTACWPAVFPGCPMSSKQSDCRSSRNPNCLHRCFRVDLADAAHAALLSQHGDVKVDHPTVARLAAC
ncbi:hypothetical protein [Mesorhizobium sp.]|uniref:hypothetical protein n=1 Tax=Mesorhizobium sp. TaxID=1871066 RepID=UPI00345CC614